MTRTKEDADRLATSVDLGVPCACLPDRKCKAHRGLFLLFLYEKEKQNPPTKKEDLTDPKQEVLD